jgi:hypothetical protein
MSFDADDARDAAGDVVIDADDDEDEPPVVPNFYDLDWAEPVPMEETVDGSSCETDPVLSSDMQWLFVSRPLPTVSGCYSDRRFHIFNWGDGTPTHRGRLDLFDSTSRAESNAHPVDGAVYGRPGSLLFAFTAETESSGTQLRWIWLEGSPPSPADGEVHDLVALNAEGGGSSPSLNLEGDRIVYARNLDDGQSDDLWESVGSPLTGFEAPVRLTDICSSQRETDPALSPDGRVLAFVVGGADDDLDIWVARREEVDLPFEDPERLPKGAGEINTPSAEMDAFISAEGDLLFVSARGDDTTRRVYFAPAIFR